jgi:branched-chain amino acid transport system ATP-binding protein
VLTIENIDCYYGDFQALRDVSMTVPEGQIVALLGPNASGKSTTLAAISGVLECPRRQNIVFDGKELNATK